MTESDPTKFGNGLNKHSKVPHHLSLSTQLLLSHFGASFSLSRRETGVQKCQTKKARIMDLSHIYSKPVERPLSARAKWRKVKAVKDVKGNLENALIMDKLS